MNYFRTNLLKSLIICGAKRCPPLNLGCVSGCVNRSKQNRSLSECASSPRSLADLEKLENRTFESLGHGNFIQRKVQDVSLYRFHFEEIQCRFTIFHACICFNKIV